MTAMRFAAPLGRGLLSRRNDGRVRAMAFCGPPPFGTGSTAGCSGAGRTIAPTWDTEGIQCFRTREICSPASIPSMPKSAITGGAGERT